MKKFKSASLILLLGLLAGCGSTSESATPSQPETLPTEPVTPSEPETKPEESVDLNSILDTFSQGIKIETNGVETAKGKETKLYYETVSKPQELSFVSYYEESRTDKHIHEYYTSQNEDGYVYGTRLDVSNVYQYLKIYNGLVGDYYRWTDGFDNLFSLISDTDFEEIEKNVFSLNEVVFDELNPYLSTLFYGNPGMTFTSLTMSVTNKTEISFHAEAQFGKDYSYIFDSNVVESGIDTKMNYRITPFEDVVDDHFSEMITSLKQNNYKAVVTNYKKGAVDSTSTFISNEDKISYVTGYYDYGYYVTSEGLLQAVEKKEDGNYYKVGAPEEADLNKIRAGFNLSRACFDYDESTKTYTLKKGVDGSMYSIVLLETIADEFVDLTITGTKELGYTFTNVNGENKTVVEFTDVGSADVGYDPNTVLDPVVTTTWQDVLTPEDAETLATLIGEENVSSIPSPEGYTEWTKDAVSTAEKIRFVSPMLETIEDDIFAYYEALTGVDFVCIDDMDTIIMQKAITVAGSEKNLIIEMSLDDVNFIIDFYFAK